MKKHTYEDGSDRSLSTPFSNVLFWVGNGELSDWIFRLEQELMFVGCE